MSAPRRCTDYVVATGKNPGALLSRTDALVRQGFEPQGGIAMHAEPDGATWYAQAFAKWEPAE